MIVAVRFRVSSEAVYVLLVKLTTTPIENLLPERVSGTVEFPFPSP